MEHNIFSTMADVCNRYKFKHRQHVDRLIRQGRFPKPVKISERAIRFLNSDLERWETERLAARDAIAAA